MAPQTKMEKASKGQAPRGPSLLPSPKLQQEGPIFGRDKDVPIGQSYVWNLKWYTDDND